MNFFKHQNSTNLNGWRFKNKKVIQWNFDCAQKPPKSRIYAISMPPLICSERVASYSQLPDERFLTKGKRGIIYKQGNIIIKVKNPESKAECRIENEAKYIKLLN